MALCVETSQATSGDTFSGAMASKASGSSGVAIISVKTPSVMRVRADGASALAVTP